jgi:hypothetical protein
MWKKSVLIVLLFSVMLTGQVNVPGQTGLTELTPEEKLDRAVMNSVSYLIMGVSFAKSQGKPAEDYARFCAELAVPAYQSLLGRNPIDVINAIYRVQQADKNFALEILQSSESVLEGRMQLYGIQFIRAANGFGGVTLDECYRFFNTFTQTFCMGIGFKYQYEVKEDWIVFKLVRMN